jgi:hypothetical protein
MGNDATKRRAALVAQVEGHPDPKVKEAVGVMLQEIAMLRGLSVVMAMHDENSLEFRRWLQDGYRAGSPPAPESAALAVGAAGR